jgi:hypothetical protein
LSWEPGKPSQNENEYFMRRDAEWLKKRRAEIDDRRAKHPAGIVCPRDGNELDERVFEGVRVDVCRACHGLWLDAGELDQLVHLPAAALQRVLETVGGPPGTHG